MFCEYCGQPLRKEDRSCRKCGRAAGRFVQMEVFRDGKGMKISEDQVDALPVLSVPGDEIQALQPSQDDETTQLLRNRDPVSEKDADQTINMNREPGVVEEENTAGDRPYASKSTMDPFRRGAAAPGQTAPWEDDERLENLKSGMRRMKILTGVLAAAVIGLAGALIVPKFLKKAPEPVPETAPIAAAVTPTETPEMKEDKADTDQKVAVVETVTPVPEKPEDKENAISGLKRGKDQEKEAAEPTPTPSLIPVVMPTATPVPTEAATPTPVPTQSAPEVTPAPASDTGVSVTPAGQIETEQRKNDQVQKQMLEGLRKNLKGI
jgi:hypothetical protein